MDPNVIATVAGSIVVAVITVRYGRDARQARVNTTPNGHGPLPEAIGTVIELVGQLDSKIGRVEKKVNRVVRDQAAHAESDEAAFDAIGRRLTVVEDHQRDD